MKLKFISTNKKYHFPVGALPLGAYLRLCVEAEDTDGIVLVLTKDGEDPVEYDFSKDGDKFTLDVEITSSGLYFYTFRAFCGESAKEYGRDAFQRVVEGGAPFTQLVYKAFPRPNWLDGGVVYQIFPDRFAVGGKRLETKKGDMVYRDDWGGIPYYKPVNGVVKNNDMFGGNLRGIAEKLDYLKALGVTCIYLNPIFSAFSNHKYNTADYLSVDGDFGSEEDFSYLTSQAATRGISVILDGVFSHTGDDSIYFDKYGRFGGKGAYLSRNGEYRDWYRFDEKNGYECWWGIDTLPNVNETEPSYKKFITEKVIPKWLGFGARGFRLDVADELPDEFLDSLFSSLYSADAIIIGEVWENAVTKIAYGKRRRYFTGGQLDSVINYPLRNAIITFIKEKNADILSSTLAELVNDYPAEVLDKLFNVLSTHDTERILNALSDCDAPALKEDRATAELKDIREAKKRLELASGLQYTLPGVPCLFYGDEAGVTGYEDPFCRACFPWGKEDKELSEHYKKLGELRSCRVFEKGAFSVVRSTGGLFVFTRGEELTIIANAGEDEYLPQYKGLKDLFEGKIFDGFARRLGFYVLENPKDARG